MCAYAGDLLTFCCNCCSTANRLTQRGTNGDWPLSASVHSESCCFGARQGISTCYSVGFTTSDVWPQEAPKLRYTSRRNSGGEPAQTAPSPTPKSEQHMGLKSTRYYTGLFKMNVGVLATCHTQYTTDSSICIFLFNRTSLQVSVTYRTSALYVHPLWFYRYHHDNWVRSKLFVACQRWWFQWRFWFVPSVPGYLREEEEHKPDPWRNPITADMLQSVWNELDYRDDIYRITKGAHIEHLYGM